MYFFLYIYIIFGHVQTIRHEDVNQKGKSQAKKTIDVYFIFPQKQNYKGCKLAVKMQRGNTRPSK
jgi:hypothetical protein